MIALGLLLLVGGYGVWLHDEARQREALRQEDARFARAEQDVDKATAAIIAAVGQPAKVVQNNSCFLPSIKIGEQPKSCSVMSDIFYPVRNEDEANALQAKVKAVVDVTWHRDGQLTSNIDYFEKLDTTNLDPVHPYLNVNYEYPAIPGSMTCSLTPLLYANNKPPEEPYRLDATMELAVMIGVSCNEDSSTVRYRVR